MTKHQGKLRGTARSKAEKMVGRIIMEGGSVVPVGSRCIKYAFHKDSDWDFLVSPVAGTEWELTKNSFEKGGSEITGAKKSDFSSMKYTDNTTGQTVNFIVSNTQDFYDNFIAAQTICECSSVKDKQDRVAVFDFINGNRYIKDEKFAYIVEHGKSNNEAPF